MSAAGSAGALIQGFFVDHLVRHKRVSSQTISAYRDTFRLLLGFRQDTHGIAPAAVRLTDLDVARILAFLDHLEQQRHNTVRTRNARLAARLALPPLELRAGTSADSARQRRVVARGVYDFAAERTWPGRSFDGTPGVALVTPLRLPDGAAVLVDRGWVPSPDAFHVEHAAYRERVW